MSIGMAVGPFVGLKVQSNMSGKASFLTIFGITIAALICVSCCRLKYPKVERKKFSIKESLHGPAVPLMLNMMFFPWISSRGYPKFKIVRYLAAAYFSRRSPISLAIS